MAYLKLTNEKRDEMFRSWLFKSTVDYVSRKCGVHRATVDRYRKLDEWDARVKVIQDKAREKLDNNDANRLAEKLETLRKAKDLWVASLIGHVKCPHCGENIPVPKMKMTFGDFDKIIRLELFLRGQPDNRPKVGDALDHLSSEELMVIFERTSVDIVEELKEIRELLRGKKALAKIDGLIRDLEG